MTTRRAVLGLAGLGLAGCAQLPVTGPVQQVSVGVQTPLERGVEVHPVPPRADASPDVVMAGFIDAMASLEPGFIVARQYLTTRAAQLWNPQAGVTVFDGDSRTPLSGRGTGLLARVVGRLDGQGHHTPVTGQMLRHDFGMVKVAGQWRIDNPPNGLLVSQYTLQHRFAPLQLWFPTRTGGLVVPERVWLASTPATPALAVQALLRGPSSWLAPLVAPALPSDAKLEPAGVTVRNGVAEVPLSGSFGGLADTARRLAAAQLAWTLRAFGEVRRVRLMVGAQPLPVPGGASNGEVSLDDLMDLAPAPAAASATPVAVHGHQLAQLGDDARLTPAGVPQLVDQPDLVAAWSDTAQVLLARSGAPGASSWGPGRPVATLRSVTTPVVDLAAGRDGQAWLVGPGDGAAALHLVDLQGRVTAMAAPPLRGRQVLAACPSPDGNVLAVVTARGAARELALLRVRGRSLDGLRTLALEVAQQALVQVVDVGWAGPAQLVLLAAPRADVQPEVYLVSVDGAEIEQLGPGGDARLVRLAVQPQLDGVRALALAGNRDVLRYESAFRWSTAASEVDAVTFPV